MNQDDRLYAFQRKYATDKLISIIVYLLLMLLGSWFLFFETISEKKRVLYICAITVCLFFLAINIYRLIVFFLDRKDGPVETRGVLLLPTQIESGVTVFLRYRGVICFFWINNDSIGLTLPKGYIKEKRIKQETEYRIQYYRRSKVLCALEEDIQLSKG